MKVKEGRREKGEGGENKKRKELDQIKLEETQTRENRIYPQACLFLLAIYRRQSSTRVKGTHEFDIRFSIRSCKASTDLIKLLR